MTQQAKELLEALTQMAKTAQIFADHRSYVRFRISLNGGLAEGFYLGTNLNGWSPKSIAFENEVDGYLSPKSDWYEVIKIVLKKDTFRVWFDKALEGPFTAESVRPKLILEPTGH